MTVVILDVAESNIRGLIARWLLELKPGVYIGDVSARVRDFVWQEISKNQDKIRGGVMAYSSNNEQGYVFELIGQPKRRIVNMDGIALVKIDTNRNTEEINR